MPISRPTPPEKPADEVLVSPTITLGEPSTGWPSAQQCCGDRPRLRGINRSKLAALPEGVDVRQLLQLGIGPQATGMAICRSASVLRDHKPREGRVVIAVSVLLAIVAAIAIGVCGAASMACVRHPDPLDARDAVGLGLATGIRTAALPGVAICFYTRQTG